MLFGFNVHTGGPLANKQDIEKIVKHGEKLGFSLLTVPDHIVFPRTINSKYPYGSDGSLSASTACADGNWFEPLTLLSYLAAITDRIKLLPAVLVIPNRPPILSAKTISSIDTLSNGRVIVGCGTGWLEEEFIAVSAPPFKDRGKVTDEFIKIYKELWTKDEPSFSGNYANLSNIHFAPRPAQVPHPPIWIGGEGPLAIKRAVKLGNGWFPVGCNAKHPLDTPEHLKKGIERLNIYRKEQGNYDEPFDIAYWAAWYGGKSPTGNKDTFFSGPYEDIIKDIKLMKELGVTHLVLNFVRDCINQCLDDMENFHNEIMPFFK